MQEFHSLERSLHRVGWFLVWLKLEGIMRTYNLPIQFLFQERSPEYATGMDSERAVCLAVIIIIWKFGSNCRQFVEINILLC